MPDEHCLRKDCYHYSTYKCCNILLEPIQKCPFFKTSEQFRTDRTRAWRQFEKRRAAGLVPDDIWETYMPWSIRMEN